MDLIFFGQKGPVMLLKLHTKFSVFVFYLPEGPGRVFHSPVTCLTEGISEKVAVRTRSPGADGQRGLSRDTDRGSHKVGALG